MLERDDVTKVWGQELTAQVRAILAAQPANAQTPNEGDPTYSPIEGEDVTKVAVAVAIGDGEDEAWINCPEKADCLKFHSWSMLQAWNQE